MKSINSPRLSVDRRSFGRNSFCCQIFTAIRPSFGRSLTRVCVIRAERTPINCHPAAIGPLLAAIIGVINSSGGVQVVFTAPPVRHSITDPRASRGGLAGSPAVPYRSPGLAPRTPDEGPRPSRLDSPAPRLSGTPAGSARSDTGSG